jgi:hypothetical protein
MTTQTNGPSEPQAKALRARARAAGVSESDFAAKVGAASIETLTRDQTRQLFDLTKPSPSSSRPSARSSPPRSAVPRTRPRS